MSSNFRNEVDDIVRFISKDIEISICSPIIIGMTTRVLEKLEKDVLKMYFE